MDQRERIFELTRDGHDADQIEQQLQIEFGMQAYCIKTVYKWMDRCKLGFEFGEKHEKPGPKPDDQLLTRIIQILDDRPFSSTRYIAQLLNEDNSTIWGYLTKNLGLVYKQSKWLPHVLNCEQKLNRQRLSKELSDILKTSQRQGWYNLMTGDSSWFNFYYGQDGAWLSPDEPPPEMDGSTLGVKKVLVTVIWGIKGFYIIDFLNEGESFNTTHFVDCILTPLMEKKNQFGLLQSQKNVVTFR